MSKRDTPLLIGFSGKIASGKSTLSRSVAQCLAGDNYRVLSYATALKNEVQDIYDHVTKADYQPEGDTLWKGMEPQDVDHIVSLVKEDLEKGIVHTSRDRSPLSRHLSQYLGTNVRRSQDNDYWITKFNNVLSCIQPGTLVVVDDVRFNNEAINIKKQGGVLVRIEVAPEVRKQRVMRRDGNVASVVSSHPSEVELDNRRDLFDVWMDITQDEPKDITTQHIVDAIHRL